MCDKKGLTLIEILVAMSILALLIMILFSVFDISLRGWKKANNLLEVNSIARIVLERMEREISSAIVKSDGSIYCLGVDGPSGWRTDSKADEFYFIAPLNPGETQKSDLCEVGYWLDGNSAAAVSDDVLRRFYVTDGRRTGSPASFDFDFSTPSGKANSNELAAYVTDLQFVYYDQNNNQQTSWDSRTDGGLPSKIKITITVEAGKGSSSTNPDYVSRDFSTIISFR